MRRTRWLAGISIAALAVTLGGCAGEEGPPTLT